MRGIMSFHQRHSNKHRFPLRILAAAFIISILITAFNWWQLWNTYNRFKEITSTHIAITENIGRIMLYDEILTMSARMCASTGDFSYEERYNQFDSQLTTAINEVRAVLPQQKIAESVRLTDEANIALVKIERQAFALTHQGNGQEALTLLSGDEYLGLKEIYANGMQETISSVKSLLEQDIEQLHLLFLLSTAVNILGVLILLATWLIAARATRIWAKERVETENNLREARDELEDRVNQRTSELLNVNKQFQDEISERRLAEERLQEKDKFVEAIVQGSAVASFVINPEHKIVFWNKACEDLTGIKSENLLGTNDQWKAFYNDPRPCIADMIIDNKFDEAANLYSVYAKSVLIPDGIRAEGWYPNLGGKNRYIVFDAAPIHDDHGKILAAIETLQDITERKKAEEDLRESQEYAKVLFTSSHIPLIVMDAETGIYMDCNEAAVQIYGYTTREEVLGKTPLDVSAQTQYNGADSATEAKKHMQACIENSFHLFEWRHQRPNGQIWDADVYVMLFQHRGKSLIQFTLQDITERKKAGQVLRESETKFRTLFEAASDAIFLMDQNVFIDCNQKTLEMFGCTTEQIIGQAPYQLSPEVQPDGRSSLEKSQEKINAAMSGQPQFFEWRHSRYDGALFDAEISLNVFSAADKSYLQVLVHDITERKHNEEKIQYLATHDSLTGLPNRLMIAQLLNHSIQSARHHKRQLAVLFIDLDRFKIINDSKGHDAGDQLLQEIAIRYKQTLREEDVVSRQGGDEFVILIEDVQKLSDLELVANNILVSTYKPVVLLGDECRVTASIGISVYPQDGEDEQSLMKHADIAMYYAKEEGKNNFQFYSKDIQSQSTGRLAIETNLRLALERKELSLHYQAKVNFKTGTITGVEALLRWQNPYLGSVTPTQFIPVAEETGMIIPIGKWVLKTACAQNIAWQKQGLSTVCMAVNLSLRQLTDSNLIDDIKAALDDSGMAPNLLELEITESMIMSNPTKMMDVLVRIKSLGVRLAIDDFGTGYSSLAQLKHFPIDTLKIDRSFIRNVPENAKDKAITHAIIAVGETLGLTVVAEGVETIEQMNYLKDQSCDEMQGYYFSRPVVPEQFADLLRKRVSIPLKGSSAVIL